jgi:hypothetical protein
MAEKTRFDKIFSKIKNNPALAVIIALGVMIIALSTFTNAARNLLSLISSESADVTGIWKTPVLTNQFQKNQQWTYSFEFEAKGTTLLGSISQTTLWNNRNYKQGILGGKIEGNDISFYIQQTSWWGTERLVHKDLFYGTVSDGEVEFIQNSDRQGGYTPQTYVAKKVE